MPAVIDLSNARTPQKSPNKSKKPVPPSGPKPPVLIGLGVAVVLCIGMAIWFFTSHSSSSTKDIVPYPAPTRNLNGVSGGGTPTNVPRGLPSGD